MAIEVDLYRSDDYVPGDRIALAPVLRPTFEALLGIPLTGAQIRLEFLPVVEDDRLDGQPILVNLRGSHGWVYVRIVRDGVILYQHPHSVREVVARPLQRLLAAQEPLVRHWGFGIVAAGFDGGGLVRPAPEVEMSVSLPNGRSGAHMFLVEEVPEPEPPGATLAQFGVPDPPEDGGAVALVLEHDTFVDLSDRMPFSDEVEEGGFLAGHVYTDQARPDRHLVVVTAVLKAERTGASLLHFTFTGESFTRVGDAIARRGKSEELVGWYHSHLFAASEALGLSTIDVDLHIDTFRRPWQIAGLVNISGKGRLVRFYAAQDDQLVQVPYGVSET